MSRSALRENRPFLANAVSELPTLVYGVEASWNQMLLVQQAAELAAKEPQYLKLAAEMAAWAWQQRPLDKTALVALVSLQKHAPVLPRQGQVVVSILDKHLQPPENVAYLPDLPAYLREAQAGGALPAALRDLANAPGGGLYWLGEVFSMLLDEGLMTQALELVEQSAALKSLPQLAGRLRAEWAMAALPPLEALDCVAAVDDSLFPHWRSAARASLLLQNGAEAGCAEAAALLHSLWRALPWHVNACLTASELLQPLPPATDDAMEKVHVLLYSWNKSLELSQTLESLAASRLGRARVTCLDNGSSDETPEMLEQVRRQWANRPELPELQVERLPVNIGAPAARQWLLHLPHVRDADYVAFLDDDIFLPPDWLGQLLSRAMATPHVSAVGCRIERHKAPHLLQAADFNLMHPDTCRSGFGDLREHIFVSNNGLGRRDSVLFGYSRPCVSVTGCCHLLRRQSLERTGGFDVRFSPSQFDDLERDLRAYAANESNLYHGSLVVRHVQHSSLQQASDRARQSHIHGNKIKLEHMFDKETVVRMATRCQRMLQSDFVSKALFLDNSDSLTPA